VQTVQLGQTGPQNDKIVPNEKRDSEQTVNLRTKVEFRHRKDRVPRLIRKNPIAQLRKTSTKASKSQRGWREVKIADPKRQNSGQLGGKRKGKMWIKRVRFGKRITVPQLRHGNDEILLWLGTGKKKRNGRPRRRGQTISDGFKINQHSKEGPWQKWTNTQER